MSRSNDVKEPAIQPLESVEAEKPSNKSKELCWNCSNHDKKNYLNTDGTCEVCGFDKNTLYNGNLEADKAAQRAEAARQLS